MVGYETVDCILDYHNVQAFMSISADIRTVVTKVT